MKYILFILISLSVISCSGHSHEVTLLNVKHFTNDCQMVAKCLDSDFEVVVEEDKEKPLWYKIKHDTNSYFWLSSKLTDIDPDTAYVNLTGEPGFFLKDSHQICEFLKRKGWYSRLNRAEGHLHSKCLDSNSRELCWEKYKRGDFMLEARK